MCSGGQRDSDPSYPPQQDDQQEDGDAPRSPPAPKMMPAPPPKENVWAKKDGAAAIAGLVFEDFLE